MLGRQGNALKPLNFYIEKHQIGTALYTNISRFNHSCNPNVAFVFDNQCQKIVLCTARFIKKGEELTISYGPVYHISSVYNIIKWFENPSNLRGKIELAPL